MNNPATRSSTSNRLLSWLIVIGLVAGFCLGLAINRFRTDKQCDACVRRAVEFEQRGDYQAAIAEYTRGLEHLALSPAQTARIYVNRGWACNHAEEYISAIADFNRLVGKNQFLPRACNGLGWAYYNQGDYYQALVNFAAAIQANPEFAIAYNNRGLVYQDIGLTTEAAADFKKALALDNDPDASNYARFNLAWLKFQAGELESALENANQGLAVAPDYAAGYNTRGIMYEDKGFVDLARQDYLKAIELGTDPRAAAYARLNLGVSYMLRGDYESAMDRFQAIIAGQLPLQDYSRIWLAVARMKAGVEYADLLKSYDMVDPALVPEPWPRPVLRLFRGTITPDQCLTAAAHRAPCIRNHQEAETLFYIGEYYLNHGDRRRAREYFTACRSRTITDSNEYRVARHELNLVAEKE